MAPSFASITDIRRRHLRTRQARRHEARLAALLQEAEALGLHGPPAQEAYTNAKHALGEIAQCRADLQRAVDAVR